MRRTNVIFLIVFSSFTLLAIIGLNFVAPPRTHAHPQYGFTPQPPPPDGGGDDDGDGGGDRDSGGDNEDGQGSDDQPPPHYVDVQIERCDLSCSANYATANNRQHFELLAAIDTDDQFFRTLVPVTTLESTVELLAPVQLIHQGSGWIAEGIISDAKNTRFAVPYPGKWEVLLVAEPQIVTAELIETTNLNLGQLNTRLENAPVTLGTVEANSTATQWVKCPVDCVIDLPPPTLPETGSAQANPLILLLLGSGIFLWGGGILIYRIHYSPHPDP